GPALAGSCAGDFVYRLPDADALKVGCMETIPPEPPSPETAPERRVNWLLVVGWLLGPSIVVLIAAVTKAEGVASAVALGGAIIGGMVCGVHFGRRLGRTIASRVLVGILSAIVFILLSLAISFAGCTVGFGKQGA